jgi:N-acetylmuramic acid 6-phosphate etherase
MNDNRAFYENYDDPEIRRRARSSARNFVQHESQFHLGMLPTEQSHPYTTAFSSTVQSDPAAGINLLLAVDQDIPPVARRVFTSGEYADLVDAIAATAAGTGGICFSGCGSTGRLSVMLEEMWRQFWEDRAGVAPGEAARQRLHTDSEAGPETGPEAGAAEDDENLERANRAVSIMTGGDRALIRAVENFEDYPEFGARQVADLGLGSGDLFIAITEGGETPSVLGSAQEALRRGATVFVLYNNPTALLRAHITRSRELIDNPSVTVLDLFTGQMALSGSTRMQATTMEMLVVGAAMEEGLSRAASHVDGATREVSDAEEKANRLLQADRFAELVQRLESEHNSRVMADLASAEASLYEKGGLVTYLADRFLLDIFSDTTERTPTFALPPFRPTDEKTSPVSWAYAKDPKRHSKAAWHAMLRRSPRGLSWEAEDYKRMEAPEALVRNPPILDDRDIDRYLIGNEEDAGRIAAGGSMYLTVEVGGVRGAEDVKPAGDGREGEDQDGADHAHRARLVLHDFGAEESGGGAYDEGTGGRIAPGDSKAPGESSSHERVFELSLDLPPSPIYLWHHLAVKLVFNTISTASMGMLGRIRGNWMIQVDPTNKKLIDRGSRIVSQLAAIPYETACEHLYRALEARRRTEEAGGHVAQSPVKILLDELGNSL